MNGQTACLTTNLFADTIMAEILKVAQDDDFTALKFEPAADDEEIIGQLSKLEKATWTLYELKSEESNGISSKLAMIEMHFEVPSKDMRDRHNLLKIQMKFLQTLCIHLIRERLNDFENRIDLRKGFKIVKTSERKQKLLKFLATADPAEFQD